MAARHDAKYAPSGPNGFGPAAAFFMREFDDAHSRGRATDARLSFAAQLVESR